jgi:hypothetical protein
MYFSRDFSEFYIQALFKLQKNVISDSKTVFTSECLKLGTKYTFDHRGQNFSGLRLAGKFYQELATLDRMSKIAFNTSVPFNIFFQFPIALKSNIV